MSNLVNSVLRMDIYVLFRMKGAICNQDCVRIYLLSSSSLITLEHLWERFLDFCLKSIKGINGNERMVNLSKAKHSIALSQSFLLAKQNFCVIK